MEQQTTNATSAAARNVLLERCARMCQLKTNDTEQWQAYKIAQPEIVHYFLINFLTLLPKNDAERMGKVPNLSPWLFKNSNKSGANNLTK